MDQWITQKCKGFCYTEISAFVLRFAAVLPFPVPKI